MRKEKNRIPESKEHRVTIACLFIPLMLSVLDKMSVVTFLISQSSVGEIDLEITPRNSTNSFGINSTLAQEHLLSIGKEFSLCSPRVSTNTTTWSDVIKSSEAISVSFVAFDTQNEKSISIGKEWKSNPIPKGQTIITKKLAEQLKVSVGDIIYMNVTAKELTPIVGEAVKRKNPSAMNFVMDVLPVTNLAMKVYDISSGALGKTGNDHSVFVELDFFWEMLVETFPSDAFIFVPKKDWLSLDLRHFATSIVCTRQMPRMESYLRSSTEKTRKIFEEWSSAIGYALSFNEINIRLPVLEQYIVFGFIGTIFDATFIFVIIVLVVCAILQIHTQTMLMVGRRAFDFGMMRVHGLSKKGVVGLLVTMALFYTIPSIVIGFVLAAIGNIPIMAVLGNTAGLKLSYLLPPQFFGYTLLILIVTLAFGLYHPVKRCTSQNLMDAIDVDHLTNSAVELNIERSSDMKSNPTLLIFGFFIFCVGGCVYFLTPVAMLSAQMGILLVALIILLIMIIVGIIAILLGGVHIVEIAVSQIVFFMENKAIRMMSLRNIVAHRKENRSTTLLCSITMGIIVALEMLAEGIVSTMDTSVMSQHPADLHLYVPPHLTTSLVPATSRVPERPYDPFELGGGVGSLVSSVNSGWITNTHYLDSVVHEYDDIVKDVSWVTVPLSRMECNGARLSSVIGNVGRSHVYGANMFAFSPNFLGNIDESLISITDRSKKSKTGDDLFKQFYAQLDESIGTVLGKSVRRAMQSKAGDQFILNIAAGSGDYYSSGGSSSSITGRTITMGERSKLFNITANAFINYIPLINSPNALVPYSTVDIPMSIPAFSSLLPNENSSLSDVRFSQMLVHLKKKANKDRMHELVSRLNWITDEMERDDRMVSDDECYEGQFHQVNEKFLPDAQASEIASQKVVTKVYAPENITLKGHTQPLVEVERHATLTDGTPAGVKGNHYELWTIEDHQATISLARRNIIQSMAASAFGFGMMGQATLATAMVINVLHSRKEIGMMRAAGMTQGQVTRIYIEEGFIVVFASNLIGLIAGIVGGYSFLSQFAILLSTSIPFVFPWLTFIIIIGVSFINAAGSSGIPMKYIQTKQIGELIRTL
eukprot:MONOS_13017.1-p1 / transcript=MONOS_13017.1 / gene=MONOS_13017 / organism=Monocercomonoides_exilis_PA203 / gene_product=DUF214 family protein / transcript_product=DUF214 family protein / location=Mono_scaffold00766:26542-30569(-) / protein_length=1100 / sequence_SO=supercontig / SO=protein_coding / is_pseudo=false